MFSNVQSNPSMNDPHRYGGTAPVVKNNGARRRSQLDAEKKKRLHGRLMNWFLQERDKQAANRMEQATDEDFYDGLQWSDEDAQALMERGQAPLVYNQIKPTINWMLGTERRTRIDGKVLPREEGDEEAAEVKTKLLKYLSDVNRTEFARSQAFRSQIIAGLGWMEDCINPDPTAELLATRFVDWKQVYHDSNATELDLSDGRYIFRWSWVDLDQAIAMCPEYKETLEAAAIDETQLGADEDDVWYMGSRVNNSSSGDYAGASRRGMGGGMVNCGRERVKLIECWYTMPASRKVVRSMDPEAKHLDGETFDPQDGDMARMHAEGFITVAQHQYQEMRCALMTEDVLLYEAKSPYRHNRFPLTPQWCYRRHRDGLPYGVVRDIRDAQIDYNKRASKALYILSTVRVIMESGAVNDINELRAEVARPDAIIEVQGKREFRIEQDKQLADQHIQLMLMNGQIIRDVGGVTDQNLGKDSDSLSGKAIGKLQDQGTIVTAALFDNKRLAVQIQTEKQLSLIEQFYTAPKVVRIIGENKPVEWLRLNQYDETEGKYLNDITKSKADFIVGEQDFRASMRQAMFESMMELVGKLPPEVGIKLLDMVIDFADVPNKEEIVARIRKINGQADPSRKPTPEEIAAQQAADAKAQELEQLNVDTARAQLAEIQAKVINLEAQAQRTAAETTKAVQAAVELGVRAAFQALQAGQVVGQMPGITPVADAILAGAGYEDKNGTPAPIPETGQPAMLPPPDQIDQTIPEMQQADGAMTGIETPAADSLIPPQPE
jgi:hypothetical protein